MDSCHAGVSTELELKIFPPCWSDPFGVSDAGLDGA